MLPVTEMQFGIVYGLTVLDMAPWLACLAGTLGSLAIALFWIRALVPLTNWARAHSPLINRLLTAIFTRTRHKFSDGISELGHFALFSYIAIPTPGSGAWTGALIAYLFDIPTQTAAKLLGAGLLCTGLLVTFGTEGILALLNSNL